MSDRRIRTAWTIVAVIGGLGLLGSVGVTLVTGSVLAAAAGLQWVLVAAVLAVAVLLVQALITALSDGRPAPAAGMQKAPAAGESEPGLSYTPRDLNPEPTD